MLIVKNVKNRILAILSVSCFFYTFTAQVWARDVYVQKVSDGDTVHTSDGERIRLLGIDTAEMGYRDNNGNYIEQAAPKAVAAKKYLEELVLNQECTLEFDQDKKDRYGRTLAFLYRKRDKLFVNKDILSQGLAVISFYPPNLKHYDTFVKSSKQAKLDKKAIWSLPLVAAAKAAKHINETRTVKGRIKSVYMARNYFYMNFGDDYKKDFTIGIVKRNLKYFDNLPDSIEKWYTGKIIEVTGRIYDRNGPYIQVSLPEQIKILEE